MRSYAVGQFLSAQWFTDANIATDANSDAYGAVFHREALALDTRQAPMMEIERDASKRAYEMNLTVWYGVAERRDTYGVAIVSDVTEPT